MDEKKEHINYTAADIERYHRGEMSPAEMHALEKAAMEDPFLEDALEGYQLESLNVRADLEELRERLEKRVADKKVVPLFKRNLYWRSAAAIVIISGLAWMTARFILPATNRNMAVNERRKGADNKEQVTIPGNTDSAAAARDKMETFADSIGDNKAAPSLQVPEAMEKKEAVRKEIPEEKTRITIPRDPATRNPTVLTDQKASAGYVKTDDSETQPSKDFIKQKRNLPDEAQALEGKNANLAETVNKERLSRRADSAPTAMYNREGARPDVAASTIPSNVFKGRVTDEQGNPLPYANVTNLEDHIGTYADVHGYFNLISNDTALRVQVRSIGFENRDIALSNLAGLNRVVLKEDSAAYSNGIVVSKRRANAVQDRNGQMKLEEPEPADGWYNYDSYLANNISIPEELKTKENSSGREVQVSFEVDANGDPVNIRVEKSLCKDCDAEAIRLIKQGPKWLKKARKAGKRVTVTILF